MRIRQWPNQLGWDIGRAEVRKCVSFLRVFSPMGADRYKRLDVPVGISPVAAAIACRAIGDIVEE
jgi:hypothetical protein